MSALVVFAIVRRPLLVLEVGAACRLRRGHVPKLFVCLGSVDKGVVRGSRSDPGYGVSCEPFWSFEWALHPAGLYFVGDLICHLFPIMSVWA